MFNNKVKDLEEKLKGTELVFSHNDLLSFNILINKNNNNEIKFIDFEYCSYNFRSFDIANHFNEYCGFDFDLNLHPNENYKKNFLKIYLLEAYKLNEINDEDIENFLTEVNYSILLSNLYWSIWSIFQYENSKVEFDYLDYAKKRYNGYIHLKSKFNLNNKDNDLNNLN
jgi:ethanolamine kinase